LILPLTLQAAEPTRSEQPENPSFPKYLLIDLTTQKSKLIDNKKVIWESIVSTGRATKETPPGVYKITDKHEKWVSSIYNVSMPNFQRFSNSPMGIHAGIMPGYPGSAGCIRLPEDKSKELFALTELGLPVVITGEAPPFEYFKAKILQAKREKSSPYSKRGTTTRLQPLAYAATNPSPQTPAP
jgi:lipoprotein-anchoring transpeptidase ErfK/SrfK